MPIFLTPDPPTKLDLCLLFGVGYYAGSYVGSGLRKRREKKRKRLEKKQKKKSAKRKPARRWPFRRGK